MNLLKETVEAISNSGHKIKDIVFIGSDSNKYSCTWNEFTSLADQRYDSSFGAQKVAEDLIIVFADGISMWRNEFDGSEWWEYQALFTMPNETKPIKSLFTKNTGWETLDEINEDL